MSVVFQLSSSGAYVTDKTVSGSLAPTTNILICLQLLLHDTRMKISRGHLAEINLRTTHSAVRVVHLQA